MDFVYSILTGFGSKTFYVQVKNIYNESNVRIITTNYIDNYVLITLNSIYINDDSAYTTVQDVSVFANFSGIPTHYKIGETSDLTESNWIIWPDSSTSTVPYTLSTGYGIKTVYL